jgi:hypothetical protein
VKIADELDEYSELRPQNTINVVGNEERYANFFENWAPIPQNDEDGDIVSNSGVNIEDSQRILTSEDIDKRAREVGRNL